MIQRDRSGNIVKRCAALGLLTWVMVFFWVSLLPAREKDEVLLKMGFVYQASVRDTIIRYQPLLTYLEKHLPLKIEPVWYDTGYQLITDLKKGAVNLVLADGSMFIYARDKLGARYVGVMKVKGGFTRRSVIVVRKDSGLSSFRDLRGKRMALVGPFDELSTLWIRSLLSAQGDTLNSFFRSVVNTMSFEASILNTLLKEVDAAAVEERTLLRFRGVNPKIRETLKIIETSPPYINHVIVAGESLAPPLLRKIRSVLVTMDNSLEGNAVLASINCDGFFPASEASLVNDQALMMFFPKIE
jgi:phosphonate transport system substrate-binding protein